MARFYSTGPQCQTDLEVFPETGAEKSEGDHLGESKLVARQVTLILNFKHTSVGEKEIDHQDCSENNHSQFKKPIHLRRFFKR